MAAAWFRRVGTWCSTTRWGSARWQRGLAAVITAGLFWPQSSVDAGVGLDPSWQAALALARIHNLAWGPEIVFTFGPLGFLQNSAYYSPGQWVFATVYQLITVGALFLGIAAVLRQRHPPMTSLIVAFVTTGIAAFLHAGSGLAAFGYLGMMYPELGVLAAFAWASAALLQRDPKRSTVFTTCIALGVVAAFQLLVKLNTGVAILAIALAVSMLQNWKAVGRHCATVAAFAASVPFWWVLAGQRPANLPAWLRSSAAVASGYSDAMSAPLTLNASAAALLSLAWLVALCAMFVGGGTDIPRRFVVLVGIVSALTAKSAFGRFELWHVSILLCLIVVAIVITPLSRSRNGVVAAAAVAITLVFLSLGGIFVVPKRAMAVVQAPVQAVNRLVTLALPGHFGRQVEQTKARQRALYAIPDHFIDTIGSGKVHIDPYETSAVWAYDLAWRPTPVFGTYAAYSPSLDKLNSDSLADGPEFVLSRRSPASPATGIDGRLAVQESPRYSRALLCNYTVSGVENRWALLTHTGPHCGQLSALSEVDVRANEVITVPAPSGPDMAVLVAIDLEPAVVDRLFQGMVAPLNTSTVVLDGVSYRLVTHNAAEPFLVSTPASVDGTNLQIHAYTIGVGRTSPLGQTDLHVRLRFYEMRVEP